MTSKDEEHSSSNDRHGSKKLDLSFRPDPVRTKLNTAQRYKNAGQLEQAAGLCAEVLAQSPDYPEANRLMGGIQQELMRPDLAIGHYEKALAAQPNHPAARFNYAHSLHLAGRHADSIEQFKLGLQTVETKGLLLPAGEWAEVYFQMAFAYRDLFMDDEEERSLRLAIEKNPNHVSAHHGLGRTLGRLGRAEDSLASLRTALRLAPGMVAAHRDLTMAKKHVEHDDELRATETLYQSSKLSIRDRSHLAFALGKAHEDLHQYQQAFEYWTEANHLSRQLLPYQADADIKSMRSVQAIFTPAYINSEGSSLSAPITPVFIVSMPRAGSSLVEQILASHSALSAGGEITALTDTLKSGIEHFPDDLGRLTRPDWERLGNEYLQRISALTHGKEFFSDKFLGNYGYLGAIRMMLPNAKIIHCARDPMDVALSCYKNMFAPGALPFSYDLADIGVIYRAYESIMANWRATLPGWIHDIDYEALTTNPEDGIRTLLDFIGLPFEAGCLRFYEAKRSTRTASEIQVRKPIYQSSVKKWRHFEQQLEPFRKTWKGDFQEPAPT